MTTTGTAPRRQIEVVADGFSYLEGPRWHDGRVFVSDFYTNRVLTVTVDGAIDTALEVPGQPSGLGWLPGGDLLVVSMKDRKLLRFDGSTVTEHADLSDLAPGDINDMVVDRSGRAYVGNFGSDLMRGGEPVRATHIIVVEPDGSATTTAGDLLIPNGMVISPDGRTLLVSESVGNRVTAFDIDESGGLSGRRVWAGLGPPPETDDFSQAVSQLDWGPDGLTMDAEGALWVADVVGRRAVRVVDGDIVESISTADRGLGVFACALGGEDGRTLFLCAAVGFSEAECRAEHRASLLSVLVDVPHAGLP